MFEFVKETFHKMALFVQPPITFALVNPIGFGWDGVIGILILNIDQDIICVIATICQNHASSDGDMGKYFYRYRAIMSVAWGQLEIHWVTQSIHYRMNLCVFTTPAGTYFLVAFGSGSPFFAPAEC